MIYYKIQDTIDKFKNKIDDSLFRKREEKRWKDLRMMNIKDELGRSAINSVDLSNK